MEINYENIPDFYDHCKFIGHNVGICIKISKQAIPYKGKIKLQGRQIYVEKRNEEKNKSYVGNVAQSLDDTTRNLVLNVELETDKNIPQRTHLHRCKTI